MNARRVAPTTSTPSELGAAHGSVMWLAGVKTESMIHYACCGSTVSKPGWTPYAAMAERYRRWQAEKIAHAAAKAWSSLENGAPCVITEENAFRDGGMNCECLNAADQATASGRHG